ncbi:MAG: hypothetical protein JF611_07915 [Betaproteobacteria bacterium]|nr:hypothetical protein [Betaproteobacteria bacterium]
MLLLHAAAASAQLSIPGPEETDQRPRTITEEQYREFREEAMRSREENAAALPPGMDKAAACAEYGRRVDDIAVRARAGGDARTMEHLNEMRRRIQAAQFSTGC